MSFKGRPDPGRGQSYDDRLKQRARDAEEAIYIDSIRKLSDIEVIKKPAHFDRMSAKKVGNPSAQVNRGLPTFGPQNFLSEIKPLGKNEIKRDRSDSSNRLPSI